MNNKIIKRVLPILLIIWICFIWGHSMQPAETSAQESDVAFYIINAILSPFGINMQVFLIRKLAHFTEFAICGILLSYNWSNFIDLRFEIKPALRPRIRFFFDKLPYSQKITSLLAPFSGLLIAMVDETIQLFSAGRSCEVRDVWIDFSGVCLGLLIYLIDYVRIRKFPSKKNKKRH